MKESQMTDGLMMRWIPVVDASGRARVEARWVTGSTAGSEFAGATVPRHASQAA